MIPKEVEEWCEQNGWTDPVMKQGKYYAFAPNAVTPQPIPVWWNLSISRYFLNYCQQPETSFLILMSSCTICIYLTGLLCLFLWDWRGIWSIYVSQADNQKFLACHYCPIAPNTLVEMKEPNLGLQEVQTISISKPTVLRFTKDMSKLVSQSEVKGRVLYLFEPKKIN